MTSIGPVRSPRDGTDPIMIEAQDFVDVARAAGYTSYAGVPCSFLTPFINFVINDERLSYISSANEGDAVATASGAAVGGQRSIVMIQNSGLGNTVSPLTSLNYVFRIPLLLICTHRGAPGLKDEPQHELMGRITGSLLETMAIPWEPFPIEPGAIRAAWTGRAPSSSARNGPTPSSCAAGRSLPTPWIQSDDRRVRPHRDSMSRW